MMAVTVRASDEGVMSGIVLVPFPSPSDQRVRGGVMEAMSRPRFLQTETAGTSYAYIL